MDNIILTGSIMGLVVAAYLGISGFMDKTEKSISCKRLGGIPVRVAGENTSVCLKKNVVISDFVSEGGKL